MPHFLPNIRTLSTDDTKFDLVSTSISIARPSIEHVKTAYSWKSIISTEEPDCEIKIFKGKFYRPVSSFYQSHDALSADILSDGTPNALEPTIAQEIISILGHPRNSSKHNALYKALTSTKTKDVYFNQMKAHAKDTLKARLQATNLGDTLLTLENKLWQEIKPPLAAFTFDKDSRSYEFKISVCGTASTCKLDPYNDAIIGNPLKTILCRLEDAENIANKLIINGYNLRSSIINPNEIKIQKFISQNCLFSSEQDILERTRDHMDSLVKQTDPSICNRIHNAYESANRFAQGERLHIFCDLAFNIIENSDFTEKRELLNFISEIQGLQDYFINHCDFSVYEPT